MTRRLVQLGVMAVMVPSDVHGVACCLSDHRSGVIFAVVVVCQQKQQQQLQQQRQLQQQEWRPWGKRCVENNYGSKEPQSVCGDHPRDVIPGLAGVIVLET